MSWQRVTQPARSHIPAAQDIIKESSQCSHFVRKNALYWNKRLVLGRESGAVGQHRHHRALSAGRWGVSPGPFLRMWPPSADPHISLFTPYHCVFHFNRFMMAARMYSKRLGNRRRWPRASGPSPDLLLLRPGQGDMALLLHPAGCHTVCGSS